MKMVLGEIPNARGVLAHIGHWSARMPGRLKNKIVSFERTIGKFRQRRWS